MQKRENRTDSALIQVRADTHKGEVIMPLSIIYGSFTIAAAPPIDEMTESCYISTRRK